MSNANDEKEKKKRSNFSSFDDFEELDKLLSKNRSRRKNSISAPPSSQSVSPVPQKPIADSRQSKEPEVKDTNNNIPNTPQIQTPPAKKIVSDAKIREGFQQERAEIFNKLENDEQYRNRHRSTPKNDDGSYSYTGRDIRSNRQKLVDVQPKSKSSKSSKEDSGITVNSNRRRKGDDSDEYEEKDRFLFSGIMKAILYIVAIIAVSVIIAFNVLTIANDVFAFVKDEFEIDVTIPENASLDDITEILLNNNLIKYPGIFEFYINYRRKDSEWIYVPGTYTLKSTMNYDEFIGVIRQRTSAYEEVRITIPEGYRIDEIIDVLVSNNLGTKEEYVDIINNYEFDTEKYKFIKLLDEAGLSPDRKYRLEGYLFPDTYNFYKNSSALQIITKFLNNFNSKFTEDFYTSCDMLGMTVDEVITLASIVEREARNPGDFAFVSSVFHNRLLNKSSFPMLESNATVQYSFDEHREDLLYMTAADIELDLPYNTYKYPGLPPSAICNPGYEAIFAAVEPEITDYFYFVSKNDGSILYGRNYQEHLSNINIARSGQ